jgi:hypothetical protein
LNFWENVKYATKVFISDPIEYIKDPANAVLIYSVNERIAAGDSSVLIETELQAKGYVKGSTWEDAKKVGSGVINVAEFTFKHGALILVLILFGVAAWYLLGLKRALA